MLELKLEEIADRINAHLKRFEADPEINKIDPTYKTSPFFFAYSFSGGRWVYVQYVSYQGRSNLTKEEALIYLAWLDAGNVGEHYQALAKHRKKEN